MAEFTQEQYTALCSSISQGVNEVWYGDKKVKFMSLAEMLTLKNKMEKALGISQPSRKRYPSFTKGLQ